MESLPKESQLPMALTERRYIFSRPVGLRRERRYRCNWLVRFIVAPVSTTQKEAPIGRICFEPNSENAFSSAARWSGTSMKRTITLPRPEAASRPIPMEPLNKSAAALSGSFAPTYRFENLEIHKVFLQFPNLNLEQNPSLTALAI